MTDNIDTVPAEGSAAVEDAPEAPAAEVTETVVAVPTAPAAVTTAATRSRSAAKPSKGGHLAQTVGRRKEAIVRVRIVPGTGNFTLNGRTLESYFPNKVHQQLVRE